MEKKVKLGSEKYPLKLNTHKVVTSLKNKGEEPQEDEPQVDDFSNIRKKIVTKYLNLPHENKTILNFDKLKEAFGDRFLGNLISNPYLSCLELKLALYFKELSKSQPEGFLCVIERKYTLGSIRKYIGEDQFLHYGLGNENHTNYWLKNSVHLQHVIEKLNMKYDEDEVRLAILNLHNFSYITATEIRWENVQKRALRNLKEIPDDKNVYGLFVKIYPMMETRDLSKYWKKLG